MTMRTYVWKAADLSRAWDQLTDFAKDVSQYVNTQRGTADIANAAVTADKLAAVPFLSLMRDTAISIASGGTETLVPMTLSERTSGQAAPLFDTTNGRAVMQLDGLYRVSALIHCAPAAAPGGSFVEAIVSADGARLFLASAPASLGALTTVYAQKTVRLLKSQVIGLYCFQNTGAPLALSTPSDRRPRLQIEYVGGL